MIVRRLIGIEVPTHFLLSRKFLKKLMINERFKLSLDSTVTDKLKSVIEDPDTCNEDIEDVVDTHNIMDLINKENFGACIYSDNLYADKIIGLKLDDIKVSTSNEYTPEDFVESLLNIRDRSILDIKNIQLLKDTLEKLKTTFEIPGNIRVYEMCD